MTARAVVDKDGQYQFDKLPAGRIRFSLEPAEPLKVPEGRLSAGHASNLLWWETTRPAPKVQAPSLNPIAEPQPRNFAVSNVIGRFQLTEKLLERQVFVTTTNGRTGVEHGKLRVAFNPIRSGDDIDTSLEYDFDARGLNESLRKTVVWARPDGPREKYQHREIQVFCDVQDDGSFECQLATGEYAVEVFLQQAGTLIAEDVATVTSEVAEGISNTQIDLGEIDIDEAMDRTTREVGAEAFFVINARDRPLRPTANWDARRVDDNSPGFQPPTNVVPLLRPRDGQPAGQYVPRFIDAPQNAVRSPDIFAVPRRAKTSPTSSLDQSIAQLVTDLLAAGDRRTRENLKQPLLDLLTKSSKRNRRLAKHSCSNSRNA